MNDVNPYEPPSVADPSEVSSTNPAKSPSFYSRLGWGIGGALLGWYFAFSPIFFAHPSPIANDLVPGCVVGTGAAAVVAILLGWAYADSRVLDGTLAVVFAGHLLAAGIWTYFGSYEQVGTHCVNAAIITATVIYVVSWYRQQMKQNQRKRPG